MTFKKFASGALPVLQAVFYLAGVVLWFKDNFPALKPIRVSPLWAFIPLAALTVLRLFLRVKARKPSLPPDWKRDAAAIGIIVVLATLTHLPFLAHSFGLMDSDEAIPALMSKHIAEGKQPPLYFYGAFFQGSLAQHYTAAFFKLFGYSVFLAKLTAFLAFALFLAIQFLLVKKAFSFGFACAAGLFYVLPWQELVRASLDLASGFPVVLLLGSLAFYLTAGVVFEDKSKGSRPWVSSWGLLSGATRSASFFARASPRSCSSSSGPGSRITSCRPLYFFIGCFPLVLNEFARGFPIVRVFFLGAVGRPCPRWKARPRPEIPCRALLSTARRPPPPSISAVIAAGILTVVLLAARRKLPPASLIFPAYFAAFMAVYLLSKSSGTPVSRYLYILYIAVPVLLGAPFLWLKSRFRFAAVAAVFALVFAVSQAGASRAFYGDIKAKHESLSRTVAAMTETGEKMWISDFWTSYLLTSLSGEKLIVASKDVKRYYPYELQYWSAGRNNWVIAEHRDAMESLRVGHGRRPGRRGGGLRKEGCRRVHAPLSHRPGRFPARLPGRSAGWAPGHPPVGDRRPAAARSAWSSSGRIRAPRRVSGSGSKSRATAPGFSRCGSKAASPPGSPFP